LFLVCYRPRHVVPFTAGTYAGINGPFILADLDARTVGYLDTQIAAQTAEEPANIEKLLAAWQACLAEALPLRQSAELIREVAETWS
jgi:hypothetical protein